MTSKPSSLRDYAVLLTGAAGFIGQRLLGRLCAEGAFVVALDRLAVASSSSGFIAIVSDLEDPGGMGRAVAGLAEARRARTALIHFAGLSSRGLCRDNPSLAFRANVTATALAMEACRSAGVRRVIFPSTALIYGDGRPGLITEDSPAAPTSVYESTKLAGEALLAGYAGAYGISADVIRLANVYGPGGHPESVVSEALAGARAGGPVRMQSLAPVRDFLHCDDVVEAVVRLLLAGSEPGCRTFNVGTAVGTSVGEMAAELCRQAGIREPVEDGGGRAGANSRLVLSNDRLFERTGFRPVISLGEGLARLWKESPPA